jgi:hypothetical protein
MRFQLLTLVILLIKIELIAQTSFSVPGEYYQISKNYPLSNEYISFTLPNPFSEDKNYIPDITNTFQHLASLPLVSDSLLSECIKYAMLSLSFDPLYQKKGTEIWYGLISNNLNQDPAVTGIYHKNFVDSTRVYILTTFSLTYTEKKKKANTSKYIYESIRSILHKYQKRIPE